MSAAVAAGGGDTTEQVIAVASLPIESRSWPCQVQDLPPTRKLDLHLAKVTLRQWILLFRWGPCQYLLGLVTDASPRMSQLSPHSTIVGQGTASHLLLSSRSGFPSPSQCAVFFKLIAAAPIARALQCADLFGQWFFGPTLAASPLSFFSRSSSKEQLPLLFSQLSSFLLGHVCN